MNEKPLFRQIAIVTGAASGLGREVARTLAAEGAAVALFDIDETALADTVRIIESEGNAATGLLCDVRDSRSVADMAAAVQKKFGRIDVLHNNVGLLELDGPVDLAEEIWDKVMDTNVKGMFLTCKHVLPVMEAEGKGAIVNISSVAAIRYWGTPAVAYDTSKAAIVQFTRSVALEYARKGIRANVILPGVMDTPLINEPLKADHSAAEIEKIREERHQMIPIGRMGDPFELAKAAAFLASDEASYITGTELIVDGGLVSTCIPNW
ncbi:MAG: SDR family oxidoreductase [Rhodospirillaceae bacterium]|nr:SDR family oxidoreductase [Rhodospirillaceae bacterium]